MAAIKISDLNPAGASFFSDSESYLNELVGEELQVTGGIFATSTTNPFPTRPNSITWLTPIRPSIPFSRLILQ